MSFSDLLGFVALLGWVAIIAGIALAIVSASQNRSPRNGVILAVIGLVVGVIFTVVSQGVLIVQPNEVAVVFDTVSGELLTPKGPGFNLVIPIVQEATLYPTSQQEYTMSNILHEGAYQGNDAVVARTLDGQQVTIDATIIYSIDPSNVNLLHRRWQNRYENELVRPTVRGVIRDEVSRYRIEDIYSIEHGALRQGVEDSIIDRFQDEGLLVSDFLIRDIQFSDEYAQSVEQKQIAEQDRLRAEQEAERLRVQAAGERDAAVERATGEADSLRLRAQAEADAILLRAQADAQALALIREQLSQDPNLVNWRYVDTLADNVRIIVLPSNSPYLFDAESLLSAAGVPAAPGAER